MKQLAVTGAAVSAVLSVTVAMVTPAAADTPHCATRKEYRKVDVDDKKTRVHRIIDFRGQAAGGGAGGYTRYYGSCQAIQIGGGDGGAYITYDGDTNRVIEKRWIGYQ